MIKIEDNLKYIKDEIENIEAKILKEKEQERADEKAKTIERILPVKPFKSYPYVDWSEEKYPTVNVEKTLADCEAINKENIAIAENNKIAIDNNRILFNKIVNTLVEYGLPRNEWRKPTRHRNDALLPSIWLLEIQKHLQLDNVGFYSSNYESCKTKLNKIKEYQERIAREKKYQIEAEEKKIDSIKNTAILSVKYGLSLETGANQVLNTILSQNKYLKLAFHLERVRGDWSDGPYEAKIAIQDFDKTIDPDHSEMDNEISECIWGIINDFDDGRQFRDSKWGYNKLFELVPADLLADYYKIYSCIEW